MAPLYPSLLGPEWSALAPAVRHLHGGRARARGTFRVRRGAGLAYALGALLRLPAACDAVDITLAVDDSDGREVWTRMFGPHRMITWQWQREGLLVEALGLVACLFRLRALGGALVFEQTGAWLGGRAFTLPLPRFLAPTITARAEAEGEGVRVDVRIHLPLLGLLVAYGGFVSPAAAPDLAP